MKENNIDLEGKIVYLEGEISPNYTIPPGVRIVCREGSTFEGVDVGGKTVYNDEYIIKQFYIADGELVLIEKQIEEEGNRPETPPEEVVCEQKSQLPDNGNLDEYVSFSDIPGSECSKDKEQADEVPVIGQDDFAKNDGICVIL